MERLVNAAVLSNSFNLREFWEFREFYSLGNFEINENAVEFGETQSPKPISQPLTELWTYRSPQIQSTDYVVQRDSAVTIEQQTEYLLQQYGGGMKAVYQDQNTVITRLNTGEWLIVFVRTQEEMRSVNGLFDYTQRDQDTLADTLWLNVTRVR